MLALKNEKFFSSIFLLVVCTLDTLGMPNLVVHNYVALLVFSAGKLPGFRRRGFIAVTAQDCAQL